MNAKLGNFSEISKLLSIKKQDERRYSVTILKIQSWTSALQAVLGEA